MSGDTEELLPLTVTDPDDVQLLFSGGLVFFQPGAQLGADLKQEVDSDTTPFIFTVNEQCF